MFDWFFDWWYETLFSITRTILSLIDGILSCANMLCGIDSIYVDGAETDILTLLFRSDEISFAFRTSVLIATILIVIFAVFAIIRNIVKERPNETPAQIAIKVAKTLLTFLFVPGCMLAFMWILNILMVAMYQATLGNANSLGTYLFGAFSGEAWINGNSTFTLGENFDYNNIDQVRSVIDLSEFSFLYSWFAGIVVLVCLSSCMLAFIERAISICILYIAAPFSIASSILDDGSRFKLWRDQILVKFINGYGMIIGLNVFCMVMGILCGPNVEFFKHGYLIFTAGFLNDLMKIVIILGGAFSIQRIQGVIGNLISQGAGSNEARENMMAASRLGGALGGMAKAPFSAVRGAYNFRRDAKQFGLGSAIGSALGFRTDKDYMRYNMEKKLGKKDDDDGKEDGDSGASNDAKPNDFNNTDSLSNAIQGPSEENNNNNNNNNSNSNENNNKNNNSQGQNAISNAIQGNNNFGGDDDDDYR